MIDYALWAQQYLDDAQKILSVIERKKKKLKHASKDERKTISDELMSYRYIYYDLLKSAEILSERAKEEQHHAA